MIIDLGLAARGKVVGHRRARLGVDLPALEEEVVEQPVGRADDHAAAASAAPARPSQARSPRCLSRSQPLAHRRRRRRGGNRAAAAPRSASGRTSALTALLRLMSSLPQASPSMSSDSLSAAGPSRRLRASARVPRPLLGVQRARDALVEPAVAQIGDIIRDHPASDLEPAAEALLEHLDVADAVLEADDQRAGRRMFGDLGRRLRVAPLLTVSAMTSRFLQSLPGRSDNRLRPAASAPAIRYSR